MNSYFCDSLRKIHLLSKKLAFTATGFLFLLFLILPQELKATHDTWLWPGATWNMYKDDSIAISTFVQARLGDEMKHPKLYFASERLRYHKIENLDLEAHYSFIRWKTGTPPEFMSQHRAEFEINPWFLINDDWKVKVRNRLELRWIQTKGSSNPRFRHQWGFTIPLEGSKIWKSIQFSNEFFYDIRAKKYNENRLIPFAINMDISSGLKFQIYYLLQSKKSTTWASDHIIGMHFTF